MMEEKGSLSTRKQQKRSWDQMQFNKSVEHDARMMALFSKHFVISDIENFKYTLPKPDSMFKEQPWQLDSLQMLKKDLNIVKSRLNDFNLDEWQRHTYQMNWAGDVLSYVKRCVRPEFTTQAWCKFYEIACNFPLVPLNEIQHGGNSFASVHLCEAPGAFVVALNHWLKLNAHHIQWDWMASTLNPHCEGNPYNKMVEDDRFIRHTLRHWHFGADNTGNLMRLANLDALVEKSKTIVDGQGPIMLVTADGSIDCTDMPSEQENAVAHLHLCETIACMHLLQKGGNFLLKVFTLFEHQSVCLMYLLSCAFHRVTATKPATSKAGNSEMYVVCLNFKGREHVAPYLNILRQHYNVCSTQAMFSRQYIEDYFIEMIKNSSRFFKHHQCEIIENNIDAFHSKQYDKLLVELKRIKQDVALMYVRNYRLMKISPTNEIVGRNVIEKSSNYIMTKKMRHDSYNERCKKQNLNPIERVRQIWDETIEEINLPGKRSYTWNLQTLPESLEIHKGELFNKICSSRFCEAKILQVLNEVKSTMDNTYLIDKFPPTENTKKCMQLTDSDCDILTFQSLQSYDSHQTIVKVYEQLKKLRAEQTLILFGYPLLTQLSVGLLYILGNTFGKVTIETHDNGGYCIKLEHYIYNEKVLGHLHEIFVASCKAYKEDMAIWSVIPMLILYEWEQYPLIMQLNHLMIQSYIRHVLVMTDKVNDTKIV